MFTAAERPQSQRPAWWRSSVGRDQQKLLKIDFELCSTIPAFDLSSSALAYKTRSPYPNCYNLGCLRQVGDSSTIVNEHREITDDSGKLGAKMR